MDAFSNEGWYASPPAIIRESSDPQSRVVTVAKPFQPASDTSEWKWRPSPTNPNIELWCGEWEGKHRVTHWRQRKVQ